MSSTEGRSRQDGGYGWVVTVISSLINFIELGTFKSFGVFILPVCESLECSTITELGTAMAASHTACYILVPLVSIMAKKYGSRWLVIGAGIVMFVSFLGIFFARDVAQFSVVVILWGMGVSFALTPSIVDLMPYFPNDASLPLGITWTGAALGMMVFPPLTEFLIEMYGWRGAILIFAAMNTNICVLGALIKPRSPHYAALTDQTAHERTQEHCCTNAAKGLCRVLSLDVLLNKPKFTIYAFACFVCGIMYSAWMIYLVPHAVTRGIGSQQASLLSTAGGVGTLVGRILTGPILHREYIKPVQLFILMAFASFVAFVLDPIVADNYFGLVCLASVNGLSLGTMAGLFIQMAQQVLGDEISVQGWGTLCVFFAVGELGGGAFAGFVYDTSGSYGVAFLMLGGLSAVTVVVLVVERLLNICFEK